MLMAIPEEEVKLTRERVSELYVSKWTIDNLTAVLMDVDAGNCGIEETTARVKAHKILNWLHVINHIEIPQKRD